MKPINFNWEQYSKKPKVEVPADAGQKDGELEEAEADKAKREAP
jgi:hypothetical protein